MTGGASLDLGALERLPGDDLGEGWVEVRQIRKGQMASV